MPVSGGRLCLSCTLAVAKPSSRPSFLPWTTRPLMLYGRPSSASAAASSPPASAARTAETFQEREVAGALRAEPEVLADEDPARLEPLREHLLDEDPGLERRKRPREALNMNPLDFVSREQFEFFSQGGEPGRRRLRREEFPRMRFERQHAADQSAPARLADEALEHRPVPEVNAVEIAHGQRDRWQRGVGSAVGKQHEAGRQRKVLNY